MSLNFCGKVRYKSEQKACMSAMKCEKQRPNTTLYWYWCGMCEGYHLTHEILNKNPDYFLKSKKFFKDEKKLKQKENKDIRSLREFDKIVKGFKSQVLSISQ